MSLSEKLQSLRRRSGQSTQQVADAVGVTKVYIWRLERGANPSLDMLKRLANHFKVPLTFFYDENIEPEQAEALRFFREYDGKLSPKEWQTLRSVAEALTSRD